MTVRLFVPLAATLIFAWLTTTYFWAVPVDSYLGSSSPAVTAAGEEREVVTSTAARVRIRPDDRERPGAAGE